MSKANRDEMAWIDRLEQDHIEAQAMKRWQEQRVRRYHYSVQPMPSMHWAARALRAVTRWL